MALPGVAVPPICSGTGAVLPVSVVVRITVDTVPADAGAPTTTLDAETGDGLTSEVGDLLVLEERLPSGAVLAPVASTSGGSGEAAAQTATAVGSVRSAHVQLTHPNDAPISHNEAVARLVGQNLERALREAYDLLALGEQLPVIRQGHGLVSAADGPGIWISMTLLAPKPTSPVRCAVIPQARFRIELWRYWPQPSDRGVIDEVGETDVADTFARDAAALWMLVDLAARNELVDGIDGLGCDAFTFGTLRPLGPLGALAGWGVDLNLELLGTPRL